MKERRQSDRLTVIQQNSQREGSGKTDVGKLLDPTLGICFTTEIPPVQHGKQGKRLFQALLLFVMPASISGQNEKAKVFLEL